ncbi:MAG: helix-turn-helix domain-containing protein [Shewanella sp.]|nr:helix-turn-helix domain-containing protein [Shewanella sp.]
MTNRIRILIINYPGSLQSAIQGLCDLFVLANRVASGHEIGSEFVASVVSTEHIEFAEFEHADVVILPPNLDGEYFRSPTSVLLDFLKYKHQQGAILCSACVGAFILAKTGLLDGRASTTHWQLAEDFSRSFPTVRLDVNSLLINDGDIISAGGLMSWIDLGLELVAQRLSPKIMRELGKYLIVDTGKREQRYYVQFTPCFSHGDQAILAVQHYIQVHYRTKLFVCELAKQAFMTERTFLRRFNACTGLKPTQYLQKTRVQKACELLESTKQSFEKIALEVGYEDANSFRKLFIKTLGLCPTDFRARFAS